MNSTTHNMITNNAVALEPLLEPEPPFIWQDIQEKYDGPRLIRLEELGIIDVVGEQTVNYSCTNGDTRNGTRKTYRLREQARKVLEEELNRVDNTLPCGHPAHINHTDNGRFDCKYCSEDRDYDRETVEGAL